MKLRHRDKIDEILNRIYSTKRITRYSGLIIGCFLMAVGFNLFFLPLNIVYGGVSGISIVTDEVFGWNPAILILVIDIVLLLISFIALGWEKTKGSIAGSILFPIFISLTANLGQYIDFQIDNILMLVLFGSVITGVGAGLNFKLGFSTGGTDIINQIIAKYAKVSIGKAMLMSDGIIVAVAGFFLNKTGYAWENTMYAIVALYIISLISDKVILGISNCKAFYIVTEHETDVKNFIMRHLSHGVTVLDGRGGYTGNHQKVIMCVIPTKEYFIAKEGILKIDPDAFFLVTDAYESSGGSLRR